MAALVNFYFTGSPGLNSPGKLALVKLPWAALFYFKKKFIFFVKVKGKRKNFVIGSQDLRAYVKVKEKRKNLVIGSQDL